MSGRHKTGPNPLAASPAQTPSSGEVPIAATLRPGDGSIPPRSEPRSTERFDAETSAIHTSSAAPSYLDHLFGTLVGIGTDASLETSATALLDAFTKTFDDVAVGVCIGTPRSSSSGGKSEASSSQLVLRRSPRTSLANLPDPTRLFSEFAAEQIVEIGAGSTMHVAAHDPEYLARVQGPAERLAMALRFVVERTRTLEDARSTERETEELRLQVIQSEKLASLGQIAAGIVHELNNPLTSILAYSDYLRREWEKRGVDAADAERLRRISEAAERILAFTRDLIAYSRPTASVPGPVDIREVLERALLFCEHVVTTNSVVVERSFGAVRLVSGVSGQLTQVFVNLITNACQAMKQGGGSLRITTEMSGDQERVIVRVFDQGHGIREEHMGRLFEPYFTTKNDGSGTGLGLPIVRNIVRSHGGDICAENHHEGAVFIVELPVSARVSLIDVD